MKPIDAITEEKRIELLAALLMTQPWTLVACGIGEIKGEDLAKRLLSISTSAAQPEVERHEGGPR